MDSLYFLEKLNDASYTLGMHPGPIKDRLNAATSDIVPLTNKDVPKKVVAEFDSIRKRLTSQNDKGSEGNFYASIDAMSEEDAIKVAQDIFDLTAKISW